MFREQTKSDAQIFLIDLVNISSKLGLDNDFQIKEEICLYGILIRMKSNLAHKIYILDIQN